MKRWIPILMAAAMAAGLSVGCRSRSAAAAGDQPALRLGDSTAFPSASANPMAAKPAPGPLPAAALPATASAAAAAASPAPAPTTPRATAPAPLPVVPSADAVAYRIRAGDSLIVTIRTLQSEQMEMQVDEKGFIRLPFIGELAVVGLTIGELESRIVKDYIEKKIYKIVTAHVFVPTRSFFVRGEVRSPGRFPIMGSVSLLQAIATASGYTDFADAKDVRIQRGDKVIRINARDAERDPAKDIPIEAGDVISVERSWY